MGFQSKIEKLAKVIESIKFENIKGRLQRLLKRLPDISHLKNAALVSGAVSLLILIFFSQRFTALYSYIPTKPKQGGVYIEGVVGRIEQFNPLYTPLNSAEQVVAKLIYSGLLKQKNDRTMIPDLAEKWETSADGLSYTFYLRKNIKWSDGVEITPDDVVFTVKTMQNPDAKSPLLEVWRGIEVRSLDSGSVLFKLPTPNADFLTAVDFAILPKHILEKVPSRNLKTAEFSIKPISSGPYILSEQKRIKDSNEIVLVENVNYHLGRPFIEKIIIKTYPDNLSLIDGYARKEIKGIERLPFVYSNKSLSNIKVYKAALPEFDVLYFNLRSGISRDKNLRRAITQVINRNQIIENVYKGKASAIYGPVLPGFTGYEPKMRQSVDVAAAKAKLKESGYVLGGDGTLTKDGGKITLRLVTSNDPIQSQIAGIISINLNLLGIVTKVEKYPLNILVQEYIKPRNFDLLLVSQNFGDSSDLYPFWHTTQINDPGLNFSGFSDRRVDKYLEQSRSNLNAKQTEEKIRAAAQIIWEESPAIFLTRPDYEYGVSNEIKGIDIGRITDQVNRFWNINNWYIFEERIDK